MIKKRWKMTCGECQAQWDVEEHDAQSIKCPTCHAKLAIGFKAEMFVTIEHSETKKWQIIHGLIEYCDRHNLWVDYYPAGTAEMGYDDLPMITGNWNPNKAGKVYRYLSRWEDELINLHWNDEWFSCEACEKAIRSIYDSYHWEPSFVRLHGGYEFCHKCIEDNVDELIECYSNTTGRALPSWAAEHIEKAGFTCLEDDEYACRRFETGWHAHQTDDPKELVKELEKRFEVTDLDEIMDWIFVITGRGQFDINWAMYIRHVNKKVEKEAVNS